MLQPPHPKNSRSSAETVFAGVINWQRSPEKPHRRRRGNFPGNGESLTRSERERAWRTQLLPRSWAAACQADSSGRTCRAGCAAPESGPGPPDDQTRDRARQREHLVHLLPLTRSACSMRSRWGPRSQLCSELLLRARARRCTSGPRERLRGRGGSKVHLFSKLFS